jgi:2-polyprenyl-3-methyl-5-hydroxy-6-metoxy-1,4-benzoquinol methylase
MSSRDEQAARAHFAERYAVSTPKTLRDIERRVLGEAWGVNGYTTVAQADALGRALRLRPGTRLLDVGTGRGYPALYLAAKTGCWVVGTDLPYEPLAAAVRRARREGVAARSAFVTAAGGAQPFRERSFDAVVLTDVLC